MFLATDIHKCSEGVLYWPHTVVALAALAQIIIFLEMLKFSKNAFLKKQLFEND
jgi:hypothetical protein